MKNWAAKRRDGYRRATRLISDVCQIAGSPDLVDDARVELAHAGVIEAVRLHDNGPLFSWLINILSYQGISNAAAFAYMERHGRVTHRSVEKALAEFPACTKLESWWHFTQCGYRKTARTCNQPNLLESCPLPAHDLRNGNLSQAAYGLFLFMRDVTHNDLVAWIDDQLGKPTAEAGLNNAENLIGPLRQIHGLSDKVLSMGLSALLLAGDPSRSRWVETGAGMIAVDTLVHNWFVRTGILRRLGAQHPYGAACYAENGCAHIIGRVARLIDARAFNPTFPKRFPRFVQHAIWRFCSQSDLAQCNAIAVPDGARCQLTGCELFDSCDRVTIPRAAVA